VQVCACACLTCITCTRKHEQTRQVFCVCAQKAEMCVSACACCQGQIFACAFGAIWTVCASGRTPGRKDEELGAGRAKKVNFFAAHFCGFGTRTRACASGRTPNRKRCLAHAPGDLDGVPCTLPRACSHARCARAHRMREKRSQIGGSLYLTFFARPIRSRVARTANACAPYSESA
jgi:hypothetical protein